MTKPFDLNDLGSKLLAALKPMAVPPAKVILDWAGESCLLHSNAIVKGIGAVVVAVEPTILAELNKAVNPPVVVAAAAIEAPKAKA